jgi:hypothetical protein
MKYKELKTLLEESKEEELKTSKIYSLVSMNKHLI